MIYDKDGITVTPSVKGDIVPLCDNLCWGDKIECEAYGLNPYQMVAMSLDTSLESFTIKLDGKPISMFGITKHDLLDTKVMFWILSTDEIHKVSVRLLRHSRDYINELLKEYDEVFNFIHGDNKKALRWAKLLGATLQQIDNFGNKSETFYKFTFKRNEVQKVEAQVAFKKFFDVDCVLTDREKILSFEEKLMSLPQELDKLPLQHQFSDGMYVRTMFIPKGMCLTGKIHKHGHPNFLLKGKIQIFSEEGGVQLLEAPQVIMSKPGVKRIGFAIEDTLWTTVHLNETNTQDIEELEKKLVVEKYEDLLPKEEITI